MTIFSLYPSKQGFANIADTLSLPIENKNKALYNDISQ